MALAYASWVSETGTLTGTDPTYTLPNTASPASGNQFLRTLGAAFTAASDVILTISNSSGAETSIWTFTPGASGAAGTIQRVQLMESSTGATINWSGQTVTIGLEIPAPVNVSAGAASQGRIPFFGSNGALDSSIIPQLSRYRAGNWYTSTSIIQSSLSPTANQLYFTPIIIFEPWLFQNIGLSPWGNPSSPTNIRLGIAADAGGRPGKLVFDAGTATVTTSGSGNTLPLTGISTIMPGLYWSIFGTDSATNSLGVVGSSTQDALLQNQVGNSYPVNGVNINSNYISGYWLGWTFGALASDYSTDNIVIQSGGIPFVGLQA